MEGKEVGNKLKLYSLPTSINHIPGNLHFFGSPFVQILQTALQGSLNRCTFPWHIDRAFSSRIPTKRGKNVIPKSGKARWTGTATHIPHSKGTRKPKELRKYIICTSRVEPESR